MWCRTEQAVKINVTETLNHFANWLIIKLFHQATSASMWWPFILYTFNRSLNIVLNQYRVRAVEGLIEAVQSVGELKMIPVRLRVEGDRATGSERELRGAPSCSQMTLTGSGGPWATQLRLRDTLATTDMWWGSTEKWGRPDERISWIRVSPLLTNHIKL